MSRSSLCPPDLAADPEGRALWRSAHRQLVADGSWWGESTAAQLETFVRAATTARIARRRIAARFASHGEAAFYALGSMKQVTLSPDVSLVRQAESDLRSAADALLLSPSSRLRAGVAASDDAGDDPLGPDLGRVLKLIAGGRRS